MPLISVEFEFELVSLVLSVVFEVLVSVEVVLEAEELVSVVLIEDVDPDWLLLL
jgi:hypothetical protein